MFSNSWNVLRGGHVMSTCHCVILLRHVIMLFHYFINHVRTEGRIKKQMDGPLNFKLFFFSHKNKLVTELVTDHRTNGPTDGRMDRWTANTSYRDGWTHLKISVVLRLWYLRQVPPRFWLLQGISRQVSFKESTYLSPLSN